MYPFGDRANFSALSRALCSNRYDTYPMELLDEPYKQVPGGIVVHEYYATKPCTFLHTHIYGHQYPSIRE